MQCAGVLAAHLVGAALLVHGCAPEEAADVDAQVRALRALGARGRAAVPALLVALKDPNARVRHTAAVALSHADPTHRGGVAILINGLDSEDWYTRWETCLALKRVGPGARAALPKLISKLCDEESDISREAALALLQVAPQDPEVADAFVKALDSKRAVDRSAVRYALRKIGVPAPSEPPRRRDYYRGEDEEEYGEDDYEDAHARGEVETAVGTGLTWLRPSVTREALQARRKHMLQALRVAGAGELARIMRRRHDDYFGFLPAGHTPREREVYRLLCGRLERDALDATTVCALGEAVWRPRNVGHALLEYGSVEARAFAATLLGNIEFDYYRACEALRRAGRDPAPEVWAAARAARERIEARRR